jgi:hypothetical protein
MARRNLTQKMANWEGFTRWTDGAKNSKNFSDSMDYLKTHTTDCYYTR